jgi:CIC family chloride channel protein
LPEVPTSKRFSFAALLARLAPTEKQRILALTIFSGAACGLAAVAFHESIRVLSQYGIDRATALPWHTAVWIIILLPALGGLVAGLMLHYLVPGAVGSGIPQVKVAYALRSGYVPFRDAIGKFVLSSLQIGTGASLGREGPTVQICGGVTSLLARLARLPRNAERRLLPVGVAAGIAAAFNAPIAAVTFTIEEVVGDLDQTMLSGAIVAAAIAAVIERSVLGGQPFFKVTASYSMDNASSLLLYAVLGILSAIISVVFTDSLLGLRAFFRQLALWPKWVNPAIGGAVTGLLAVAGFVWAKSGGVTGGGYDVLNTALVGGLGMKALLILCVLKLAATVFSYSSGGSGGIFAPALFIGGMLGGALGWLDVRLLHHSPDAVGSFALVGMGAVFAGIIRAPITSVLIIFEMTRSYDLILPLMVANMTAYALARHWRHMPIYEALLNQDGITLPHPKPVEPASEPPAEESTQSHLA